MPTILVYRDGEIRRQVITLREFSGVRTGIRGMSFFSYSLVGRVGWLLIGGRY